MAARPRPWPSTGACRTRIWRPATTPSRSPGLPVTAPSVAGLRRPSRWRAAATTTFTVTGVTPPGNLTVSASTSGSSLDPDGYTVTVDGGSPQALTINGSVSYTSLTAGNHTVAISGVAGNCTVSGGTSRTMSVPSGGTATTTVTVSCVTPHRR